jgi:CHASE1-domain containing sensor protein
MEIPGKLKPVMSLSISQRDWALRACEKLNFCMWAFLVTQLFSSPQERRVLMVMVLVGLTVIGLLSVAARDSRSFKTAFMITLMNLPFAL